MFQQKIQTLNKLNKDLKMDDILMKELQAYLRWISESEKEEKFQFIQELPERLRSKMAIYIYE